MGDSGRRSRRSTPEASGEIRHLDTSQTADPGKGKVDSSSRYETEHRNSSPDTLVKLQNGSEVSQEDVEATMAALKKLMNTDDATSASLMAVSNLREKCRGKTPPSIVPDYIELQKDHKLLEPDGTIRDSVKNVVLSAMCYDNPTHWVFQSPIEDSSEHN